MNILVIGNGFDIEHGLPTLYKDFLDFMQCINFLKEELDTANNAVIDQISFDEQLENKLKHTVDSAIQRYFCEKNLLKVNTFYKWTEEEIAKELINNANNNIWVRYFIKNMDYEKDGWIDFESEICNVIKCFEYMKKYSDHNRKGIGWPREEEQERADKQEIVQKIINYSGADIETFELLGKKLREIVNILNDHLNDLIRCLEIYLEDCVGNIEIEYLAPDLENFEPDKVLSFNYTKTHKKYYKCENAYIKEEQYEYIHGQAMLDRSKQDNNMVLGIDEYLDDDKKDKELDFIEFKKYYQRIYKRTGNKYKKWIDKIKSVQEERIEKEKDLKERLLKVNNNRGKDYIKQELINLSEDGKNEIYIFGHSLDVTDKDIIKELIVCPNTVTTIFYYNKEAYAQQIANVVKIIGQDELIKRVSGADPTIIFKQQQQRIARK